MILPQAGDDGQAQGPLVAAKGAADQENFCGSSLQ